MAKLVWDQEDQKRYEFGIDRGVFYDTDSLGMVWNGLIRVSESSVGGEMNSYHFDGVKYLDTINPRNYEAVISAYSAPDLVNQYTGEYPLVPGFILTRQARSRFGLSYRTSIGPDVGYKVHIIYNILASPTQRIYPSVERSIAAQTFSWKISAVPPIHRDYRPGAHYILDSTRIPEDALDALEDILYGTDQTPARLPSIDELLGILTDWAPLRIDHNAVTGLSPLIAGMGDLYQTTPDGFHLALPETRLQKTPIDGLYRLE